MPKRKREEIIDDGEPEIQDQALRIKVSRLRAKLDQGLKSLTSALKLARGFERQKLGRRQKTANNEPHTLLRLREEVIVLKQLQLDQTAKNYLLKQLSRRKRIRESPVFIQLYGTDPSVEPTKPGAEANVLGRLFKSAAVKQALSEIMKNAFGVLGLSLVPGNDASRTANGKGKPKEIKAIETEEDEFNGFSSDASIDATHIAQDSLPLRGDEEQTIAKPARDWLTDSDAESGSKAFSEEQNHPRENLSVSSDDIEESDLGSLRGRRPAKLQNVKPTQTAFLPSLSMGGYYSGSESDDDAAFDHRGRPMPQIRKNRRGQRARQQLAEMKYGKNARHLQTQKSSDGKNSGWDARKGAMASAGTAATRNKQDRVRNGSLHRPSTQASRPDQTKPKTRDDQGSLHPSWEAAKKKKMQDQGLAKFAGKKITFD